MIDISGIKNFLLKYGSSRCFSTSSFAVLSGAAPLPFRIFAGGISFPKCARTNSRIPLYSKNSSNAFRRLRRRRPAPKNLSGFATIFDNFKFFYELIITHYSNFFKKISLKNLLLWRQILLALLQKKAPFEVFVIDESYKGAWVRSRCFTWRELCGVYREEKPRIPAYTGQQTSLLAVGPL